jgi:CRP/FNR family transcriptional regulator, cyclic AMP receptor protein
MSARDPGIGLAARDHPDSALRFSQRLNSERQPNVFEGLSKAQSKRVMASGSAQHLARGEILFAQGERHCGVFLIKNGLIRTFHISPAGREITLAYWQPGNIVGTPQVLGSGTHMWSGVAVQESDVYAFQGDDLRKLIMAIPEFAIGMVEALEFKGKCLSAALQMLGTRSVSERLAILLINLAEIHGVEEDDGVAIGPPFTHEAFSQMVGASRQWVTMTLDRFQREGLIRISRCKTVILDSNLLRKRPTAFDRKSKDRNGRIAGDCSLLPESIEPL